MLKNFQKSELAEEESAVFELLVKLDMEEPSVAHGLKTVRINLARVLR
jgi:hypothetical protein